MRPERGKQFLLIVKSFFSELTFHCSALPFLVSDKSKVSGENCRKFSHRKSGSEFKASSWQIDLGNLRSTNFIMKNLVEAYFAS